MRSVVWVNLGFWLVLIAVFCVLVSAVGAYWRRLDRLSALVGAVLGFISGIVSNLLVLALLLTLGGCSWPPAAKVEKTIADQAAESASIDVAKPEATVPQPAPVVALVETEDPCGISQRAINLIIAMEVGSPQTYVAKYQHPLYPGGPSGTTVGFGSDLGYRLPEVIQVDWGKHPAVERLMTASGIRGPPTRAFVRTMADIAIGLDLAQEVFERTEVVEYTRLARRAFGEDEFCAAPPDVRGALTSLVFNRGASMSGPNRIEMRAIRDVCLPARDWGCVAQQMRTMRRIWVGTDIERGMSKRRALEAQLAEAA